MPKQTKTKNSTKTKTQSKAKRNVQPETPGITTKKSYWIMLTIVMVAVFTVASIIMKLSIVETVVLMFTIALLLGLMGFVSTTPSNLSKSRRATFLFAGASIIGFGIWAITVLTLTSVGIIESIFPSTFFLIPSFIMCLTIGAFIGELLGRNKRVQAFAFKPENTPP